jgi:hypothetical protein
MRDQSVGMAGGVTFLWTVKAYDRGGGGGGPLLKRAKWRTPSFLHFPRSGYTPAQKLATALVA